MSALIVRAPLGWARAGSVLHDAQVVREGDAIAAVEEGASPLEDVEVVDVDGFLMPAAADRHVHIGLADPGAVLLRGVTAVRDLAWPADRIFALADASETSSFTGPLIRAAGPMLAAPGGYPSHATWAPPGTARELAGPQDAADAVAELAALGATAIKVSLDAEAGPTPTDAELAAVCVAAAAAGIPVTAHAQGAGQVERALGAGVGELAHTPWTETMSDDVIRAAVTAGMRLVSTLDIQSFGLDTPALRVALDNLRRFHAAGGEVRYGTDLGNGPIPPGIHTRELLLLAEAGLELDAILTALVRAPLEPGAPADLIVLDGDPREGLKAFDALVLVVRAGRVAFRR